MLYRYRMGCVSIFSAMIILQNFWFSMDMWCAETIIWVMETVLMTAVNSVIFQRKTGGSVLSAIFMH